MGREAIKNREGVHKKCAKKVARKCGQGNTQNREEFSFRATHPQQYWGPRIKRPRTSATACTCPRLLQGRCARKGGHGNTQNREGVHENSHGRVHEKCFRNGGQRLDGKLEWGCIK